MLIGITSEDIGLLNSAEFAEVWNALGKIAWARGQAQLHAREEARAEAQDPVSATDPDEVDDDA